MPIAPPTEVLFARGQMAYSLGFHIVFAAVGIAMPLLMVIAEIAWRRTRDPEYLALAKRWANGTAVFFAIGAVSGTALSFELGLLFPTFMLHAGPLVGLPFSLEGFAFFTEAIFLGIYLYGRDRVPAAAHVASGIVVALSGVLSAAFVVLVNAWMNAPRGFTVAAPEQGAFSPSGGEAVRASPSLTDIDPIAAMASPFALHEILHTILASYLAVTLAVAAIHAFQLLRGRAPSFHRRALAIALAVTIPTALAQPLVGHFAGQQVAEHQPMKLAAMEGLLRTQARAPLHVGPIAIPGLLSWMAFGDADAVVKGLEEVPPADRPHPIVRVAFQVMVALGTLAAGYALISAAWWIRRRRLPEARWWLWATVALGPVGFVATEAGWVVTEVGRQPWTITGFLRTADAVTPVRGLWLPFVGFAVLYLGLAVVCVVILVRQVRASAEEA